MQRALIAHGALAALTLTGVPAALPRSTTRRSAADEETDSERREG
jgi:hypothetical protein